MISAFAIYRRHLGDLMQTAQIFATIRDSSDECDAIYRQIYYITVRGQQQHDNEVNYLLHNVTNGYFRINPPWICSEYLFPR